MKIEGSTSNGTLVIEHKLNVTDKQTAYGPGKKQYVSQEIVILP